MDSQLIQPNISVFFYVFPKKQGILSSNRWNTISNLKSWSDSVLEILIIAWRKLLTSVHSTNTRVKLLPEKLHHWGRKQKGPQVTQSQTRVWNPLRDSREARHSQAPKRPHYTGSQLPPPMLIFLPPKSPPSAQGLQVRDTEPQNFREALRGLQSSHGARVNGSRMGFKSGLAKSPGVIDENAKPWVPPGLWIRSSKREAREFVFATSFLGGVSDFA